MSLAPTILHRLRRAKWHLLSLLTVLPLVLDARSQRRTEVWFGDSHAMCFNGPRSTSTLTRGVDGQFVVHLGPRLMYSLARDDFPPTARWIVRMLARIGRRGTLVVVFCTGEIDVRCHLVPRAAEVGHSNVLDFVPTYVDRCIALAEQAAAAAAVFMLPPPPSITCPLLPEFPIRGSIGERVAMRGKLGLAVEDAVRAASAVSLQIGVVDAAAELGDGHGGLDARYTDDGCHTNEAGVVVARRVVAKQLDAFDIATASS